MIAYPTCYLADAKVHLGVCFDFGINECGVDGGLFSRLFSNSRYGALFAQGNPHVLAGMSGVELACHILADGGFADLGAKTPAPKNLHGESPQYWAGWALAHYQWSSVQSFSRIFAKLPYAEIEGMYGVYHEADISLFLQEADRRVTQKAQACPTNLKARREACGLSQSQLARAAQVGLRSIQMYEQRVNDIDRAQGDTLFRLAAVLGCSIEDLLERPVKPDYEYASVKI